MVTKVHHVALCTTDVAGSLRFWRDGLGFEQTMDKSFDGEWEVLFDAGSGTLRSIFLGDPADPTAGVVELVDFGTELPDGSSPPAPARGFFLISVNVALDAALERLAALGLGGEPRRIRHRGVGMAVVTDPNGVRVELIDRPEGSGIAPQ